MMYPCKNPSAWINRDITKISVYAHTACNPSGYPVLLVNTS